MYAESSQNLGLNAEAFNSSVPDFTLHEEQKVYITKRYP